MKNRRLCAVSAAAARVIHRVGRVERLGCALGSVVCARGAFAKQERWTLATRASRHTRPLGGRPMTEPFRNAGFPRGPTAPEILCSRCREEPRLPHQGWFLAGLTAAQRAPGRLDEFYTPLPEAAAAAVYRRVLRLRRRLRVSRAKLRPGRVFFASASRASVRTLGPPVSQAADAGGERPVAVAPAP